MPQLLSVFGCVVKAKCAFLEEIILFRVQSGVIKHE